MILPFIIFLCWGSFLNVFAYRFIAGGSLYSRSACPHCHLHIVWYDLIPVISWLLLKGRCRYCSNTITILYPCIELLTAVICMYLLYTVPAIYFMGYFLFASALIIMIRTDAEFMLIPTVCTLYLIPVGMLLSFVGRLPISLCESIAGAALGYCFLAGVAYLYKKRTEVTGLGDADPELLACIGSFLGITGVWYTLLIGSVAATVYALILMALHRARMDSKIPFGPFLALGALASLFLIL